MGNLALWRFDELETADRPRESEERVAELEATGAGLPDVVDAATGRGRRFTSADSDGLAGADVDSGATLITRTGSIQVILSWDIAAAAVYGSPQTIYARGKGTGAGEYVGLGLELRVVNAALRIGEVRFVWHTIAGVLKTQVGGHFQLPADGFVMLTATRRWVSSSRVVLRYYLGDALLAEIESTDGDIGGGTTGTTSIGTRYTGAAWGRFFDGVIDELRVVDEELTAEEVAATWDRITVQQPAGYKLVRDAHDPGFPISQDPTSRAQRETRMWGDALGYAAAQGKNLENLLPSRAYGEILERWEAMTRQSPKPGDDVDKRRRRVVGRIRQKRGISIPGAGDALRELLATDPANLEFYGFDQTVIDDLSALLPLRWRYEPSAAWTISGGATRVQSAVARTVHYDWATMLLSVGGDGRGVAARVKVTPATLSADGEVGITFVDRSRGTGTFFGLRRDPAGANVKVVTESFDGWALEGATVQDDLGGALAPVWLRLRAGVTGLVSSSADVRCLAEWSTVGPNGPWDEINYRVPLGRVFHWAGFYARTFNGTASNVDAKFADAAIRAPYGDRSSWFYILRDPADPGEPDRVGADNVTQALKQLHTGGHVIASLETLYDDDSTPYDLGPMGGL